MLIDSFKHHNQHIGTFDGMGQANVNAMTPVIKQLLGIDRPQVA